ncbi:MAG: CBS domain-containing protein [Gallionella sp.]
MPNTMLKIVPSTVLKLNSVQSISLPIPGDEPWYVSATDPALLVMIDYRSRHSVTVSETDSVDQALDHMKHVGVRCAFVIDEKNSSVVGMITSSDILGEKPQQHMHYTACDHDDVLVKDIMQKINDWCVVNIKDIENSTVGDLRQVFNDTGVTHLPVMETTENNEPRLRGLLSSAKVKRLLVE